jgi:hypothetical protein
MFSGPPLPLSPDFPIKRLVSLTSTLSHFGAWVRGRTRDLLLGLTDCGFPVLISGDLGVLLRHCRQIALREGNRPVILDAEQLIQWRALQVVTARPHLPCPELLKEVFPEAFLDPAGFKVPIQTRTPEEVLAECLVLGIPVAESRIVYSAPLPDSPASH